MRRVIVDQIEALAELTASWPAMAAVSTRPSRSRSAARRSPLMPPPVAAKPRHDGRRSAHGAAAADADAAAADIPAQPRCAGAAPTRLADPGPGQGSGNGWLSSC